MATETASLPIYHRGDPLDIPLIDQHLVNMLSPRITSAIRYAFPELYLDWTTGVSTDESTPRNAPFIRKRWVEMLLHISLLLGSCQIRRKVVRTNGSNNNEMNIYLATPAMKNLGMILQSTSNSNQQQSTASNSRQQQSTAINSNQQQSRKPASQQARKQGSHQVRQQGGKQQQATTSNNTQQR